MFDAKNCLFLPQETPFMAFLSQMPWESQHTSFKDQILGQVSLWGRPARCASLNTHEIDWGEWLEVTTWPIQHQMKWQRCYKVYIIRTTLSIKDDFCLHYSDGDRRSILYSVQLLVRSAQLFPWCSMMFDDVLWCSLMFHDVLWCSMMFYDVLWCSMMFDVLRAFLVSFCWSVLPEFPR